MSDAPQRLVLRNSILLRHGDDSMHPMRMINKLSALLLVSLFAMSFVIAGSTAAVPDSTTNSQNPVLSDFTPVDQAVYAEEGTNVDWYTDTGSYNDTWTWQDRSWRFGPKSTYEIYYERMMDYCVPII